ncbi:hypothetical protein PR048_030684 [Dryococelus australis]|uniref:Uncharacterized protein n=1 Tax=Dryococelus australis TaxID=614101 RepID=A0ABQ9GAD5_9NEOP|nr:hypothetical protein PR048_030684 [Dryococelus australis]
MRYRQYRGLEAVLLFVRRPARDRAKRWGGGGCDLYMSCETQATGNYAAASQRSPANMTTRYTSTLTAPSSSLSIDIGCCLSEKASSYLTGPLRIQQHRHGSYDKIDVQHEYTEVDFAIGSQFIRHALDDFEPIADWKGNKEKVTDRRDVWPDAAAAAAGGEEKTRWEDGGDSRLIGGDVPHLFDNFHPAAGLRKGRGGVINNRGPSSDMGAGQWESCGERPVFPFVGFPALLCTLPCLRTGSCSYRVYHSASWRQLQHEKAGYSAITRVLMRSLTDHVLKPKCSRWEECSRKTSRFNIHSAVIIRLGGATRVQGTDRNTNQLQVIQDIGLQKLRSTFTSRSTLGLVAGWPTAASGEARPRYSRTCLPAFDTSGHCPSPLADQRGNYKLKDRTLVFTHRACTGSSPLHTAVLKTCLRAWLSFSTGKPLKLNAIQNVRVARTRTGVSPVDGKPRRSRNTERLERSPPTKANRVRFPVGSLPAFLRVGIVPDYAAGMQFFSGISRHPIFNLTLPRFEPFHNARPRKKTDPGTQPERADDKGTNLNHSTIRRNAQSCNLRTQ